MSSTRRAPQGTPISYEKYMSSPEYAEMRGIPGTAVAVKAQLYNQARKRSLLFFLQSLSLKEGGLREVARELIGTFPKRVGEFVSAQQTTDAKHCNREEELLQTLVEFCINPKCVIRFSNEKIALSDSEVSCSKLADTLRDFQDRYEGEVRSDFVLTTIGREIFETLDYALDIGKMVVIEGESGSGKTTAADAWCAVHQGQARFVSLSGITHKTGFFRKLAAAIGLAAAKGKATDMQLKVEEFFRKTRLMLVIDEAHYLWPQYHRSESSPELVDWVNTALVNHRVPVALICTDQFAKLKAGVEKRTGWTSEQFEHRVKRYKKLPSVPTKRDLEAVAAKLLAMRWNPDEQKWSVTGPKPHPDFVKMVVGYALTCKMPSPAVADAITEARREAREHRRSSIAATDIRDALLEYQIPSDEALQRAFETSTSRSSSSIRVKPQSAPDLPSQCNGIASALQYRRSKPR